MAILIPGYREITEQMLRRCLQVRKERKKPMANMPEPRFQELIEYAKAKIESVKEIEGEAARERVNYSMLNPTPEPPARERYKARLDDARRAIYLTRDEPLAQTGARQVLTQSMRRKDKPASNDWNSDGDRNARIRRRYAAMKKAGERNITATLASEFGLSASQIRRIVKAGKRA